MTAEQMITEYPLPLQRVAALEAQLAWFKKRLFGGGKNERLDVTQRQLALEGVEAAQAAVAEKTRQIAYERSKSPRATSGLGGSVRACPRDRDGVVSAGAGTQGPRVL